MADSQERFTGGGERTNELEKAAAERSAELAEQREARAAHERHESAEQRAAEARAEAQAEAKSASEVQVGDEREKPEDSFTGGSVRQSSGFKQTMAVTRKQLSVPSRVFSRFIHAKPIEALSDVVGSTVARPDAILSGAIFAFVGVLALYTHARHYGYELRGSETIIAFVIGWLAGILFDIVRRAFRRRR